MCGNWYMVCIWIGYFWLWHTYDLFIVSMLLDFPKKPLVSLDVKLQDELEITSKKLGQRGRYLGTIVLLRNKATGEIIAEGRHSLFRSNVGSKL